MSNITSDTIMRGKREVGVRGGEKQKGDSKKGNEMTALRFQTVLGHQTSTASHRGWGGGGDRDTQTHGMLDRRANRKRTTERRNSKRCKPRNYRSGQTERGQQKGGTTKDASQGATQGGRKEDNRKEKQRCKPGSYRKGQTERRQQGRTQRKMRAG